MTSNNRFSYSQPSSLFSTHADSSLRSHSPTTIHHLQPPTRPSMYYSSSTPTTITTPSLNSRISTPTTLTHPSIPSSHHPSSHHTNLYAPLSHHSSQPTSHLRPPSQTSYSSLPSSASRIPTPSSAYSSTAKPATQSQHSRYEVSPPHTLDRVLEKVKKTLNDNAALRERSRPDMVTPIPNMERYGGRETEGEFTTTYKRSTSPTLPREKTRTASYPTRMHHSSSESYSHHNHNASYDSIPTTPISPPSDNNSRNTSEHNSNNNNGNNDEVIRLLETNRKKFSELMQKLSDADTRLMVNKERYNEVKESLVGALKNLEQENLQSKYVEYTSDKRDKRPSSARTPSPRGRDTSPPVNRRSREPDYVPRSRDETSRNVLPPEYYTPSRPPAPRRDDSDSDGYDSGDDRRAYRRGDHDDRRTYRSNEQHDYRDNKYDRNNSYHKHQQDESDRRHDDNRNYNYNKYTKQDQYETQPKYNDKYERYDQHYTKRRYNSDQNPRREQTTNHHRYSNNYSYDSEDTLPTHHIHSKHSPRQSKSPEIVNLAQKSTSPRNNTAPLPSHVTTNDTLAEKDERIRKLEEEMAMLRQALDSLKTSSSTGVGHGEKPASTLPKVPSINGNGKSFTATTNGVEHLSPRERKSPRATSTHTSSPQERQPPSTTHQPSPREITPPSTNSFAVQQQERPLEYADDESVDSEEELTFVAPGRSEYTSGGYRTNEYNGYNSTKDFGGYGRYNGYSTGKDSSAYNNKNFGYNNSNSGYNYFGGGGATVYNNTELETESGEEDSIFASRTLEEKIRGL